jgi:integrase
MIKIREKKLSDGRRSIYLDICYNKQRHYEFLNLYLTGDKIKDKEIQELAEQVKHNKELELAAVNFNIKAWKNKENDFIKYAEKIYQENKRYSKIQTVLRHIRDYSGSLTFKEIDETWYKKFDEYLQTKMQKSSINTLLTAIKVVLNRAVKNNVIEKNPLRDIRKHKHWSRRVYFTPDEVVKLNNTPCSSEVVRDAFIFSCFTGLRLIDIEGLIWKDIDNGNISKLQHKTKEPVFIPLHEIALDILERRKKDYSGPGSKVFKLPCRSAISVKLKTWFAAAGFDKEATFHSSRHTFATMSIMSSNDLYTVKELLGHTDIETTQIYAHIVDRKKINVINSLPGLSKTKEIKEDLTEQEKLIVTLQKLKDKGLITDIDQAIKEVLKI